MFTLYKETAMRKLRSVNSAKVGIGTDVYLESENCHVQRVHGRPGHGSDMEMYKMDL